ncbi:MAG: NUDIX domain-containing protein [Micavibrio sp.]
MLEALMRYDAGEDEAGHRDDIADLFRSAGEECLYRTHFSPGHITGSGLLVSADGARVLMNHHKFLNIWICFGGHADGNGDILDVARREVMEESGIADIEPAIESIFSVDVHAIPPNDKKGEPAHKHFDIRYLFRVRTAENENFRLSAESNNLRWCGFDDAMALSSPQDHSMHRLLKKWKDWRGL